MTFLKSGMQTIHLLCLVSLTKFVLIARMQIPNLKTISVSNSVINQR